MNTKTSLLFVSDEELVGDIVKQTFQLSHEVFIATSGSEALKILAVHDIQVIISALQLPGISGLELLSTVRQRSPATVKILLVEASEFPAMTPSAIDIGIFRLITQPLNREELKSAVREASELAVQMHEKALTAKSALLNDSPRRPLEAEVPAAVLPGLLVLVGSTIDRLEIMQMFADDYRVHGADDVAGALNAIDQHDVGVLICETHVCNKSTGPFLRVLKLNYPAIQTVMLTSSYDKEMVIKMIHQVQIFRFVMKPVTRPRLFRFAVSAAMKEHRTLCLHQRLVKHVKPATVIENLSPRFAETQECREPDTLAPASAFG